MAPTSKSMNPRVFSRATFWSSSRVAAVEMAVPIWLMIASSLFLRMISRSVCFRSEMSTMVQTISQSSRIAAEMRTHLTLPSFVWNRVS